MQKLFRHCGNLDKRCYEQYALSEEILMEHAAIGMERIIRERFAIGSSVLIAAGKGNNGADGIALSRLLHGDYAVRLYMPFGVKSEMAKLQLTRAETIGVNTIDTIDSIDTIDVTVDALLGSGIDGGLDSDFLDMIKKLNSLNGYKLACDIPTGISTDGQVLTDAFIADMTVTMGAYKEALYLDEAKDFVGQIVRTDLGLHSSLYENDSSAFVLEESDLSLPLRTKQSTHKGSFGHAAVFCGEKDGAGIIAGTAALRFGAGLVTLVIHEKITPPPYLMTSTIVPDSATALAIGMGLGKHFESEFLQKYVVQSSLPLVLDADSFYSKELLLVTEDKERKIILTPHPKEFVSLWKIVFGEEISVSDIQKNRLEFARKFSKRFPHTVLLLKGANMLIAQSEKLYINPLGTARLSKGGSGDVLSGLIAALLAQGYSALDAAVQGSLALTAAARRYSGADYAMTSTDLIDMTAHLDKS